MVRRTVLCVLLGAAPLAALLAACGPAVTLPPPPQTGDGWQTASPFPSPFPPVCYSLAPPLREQGTPRH